MQRLWRNYRTNRRWRAGVSQGVHLAYGLYKGALALTASIGGVNFYTIRENRAVVYPWHLIYGAAAYTFYSLTVALVRLLRRGEPGPLAAAVFHKGRGTPPPALPWWRR